MDADKFLKNPFTRKFPTEIDSLGQLHRKLAAAGSAQVYRGVVGEFAVCHTIPIIDIVPMVIFTLRFHYQAIIIVRPARSKKLYRI